MLHTNTDGVDTGISRHQALGFLAAGTAFCALPSWARAASASARHPNIVFMRLRGILEEMDGRLEREARPVFGNAKRNRGMAGGPGTNPAGQP